MDLSLFFSPSLCMHSTSPPFVAHLPHHLYFMHALHFSCLCSHSLYFTFLHFTLVRCMLQFRPVAGSTWSPNPSPIASGFVAGRFRFATRFWFRFCYQPVSGFACWPVLLPTGFRFCLPASFRFCLAGRFPVLLAKSSFVTNRFPVFLAGQFIFQPVPFYGQPVLGT